MAEICELCKSPNDVCFRRYYSTKQGTYYFFSVSKKTTLWAPNGYQLNHLCTHCVELICEGSWVQCMSSSTPPRPYFFNMATLQSTYTTPSVRAAELASMKAAIANMKPSCSVEVGNKYYRTPAANVGKRDYFFKGMNQVLKEKAAAAGTPPPAPLDVSVFQVDDVASFSVTESKLAATMTDMIVKHCGQALCICDGMACVGGNTISFAQGFAKVVSNEYDYERYHMLVHNVRGALGLKNVEFYNRSVVDIIDQARGATSSGIRTPAAFNILFLDPEWGGRDYMQSDGILLTIADIPLEDFILRTFAQCPSCAHVVAKLPCNYNNAHLKKSMTERGFTYRFDDSLPKMTVTFIGRPANS
jgi:hypothetical protein